MVVQKKDNGVETTTWRSRNRTPGVQILTACGVWQKGRRLAAAIGFARPSVLLTIFDIESIQKLQHAVAA